MKLIYNYEYPIRFICYARHKKHLLDFVKLRRERTPTYRYNPNELYDWSAQALFRIIYDRDSFNNICFAERGSTGRTEALRKSLLVIAGGLEMKEYDVKSAKPKDFAELQICDYLLWAVQRALEKGKLRYYNYLSDRISNIFVRKDKKDSIIEFDRLHLMSASDIENFQSW